MAGSIWAREPEENTGAHVQVRRQLGRAPFGSLHESSLRPSRGPGAASTDERLGRKTRAPETGVRVTGTEKGVKARTRSERVGKSERSETGAEKPGRGPRMTARKARR